MATARDLDMTDGPCVKYGMCICSPESVDLVQLRNRLFRVVKASFHREQAPERKFLLDRKNFIRVNWVADDTDDEDAIIDWGLCPLYWHTSKPILSPDELMMQLMRLASHEQRVNANAADDEICVEVSVLCIRNH